MEFGNILLMFQELAGCQIEDMNGVIPLVKSAAEKIEGMLIPEAVLPIDIPRCEYAAACTAFYDYACREGARSRITVTQTGKADVNADLSKRIEAAEKLKAEAMDRLRGIIADGDFTFMTVED